MGEWAGGGVVGVGGCVLGWHGGGGGVWEGKTQKSLSHITLAWFLPPAPAVGFPGSADLVLENWSRGAQVIKLHLPGCMLLTFVCVSITQMPQILSLQD